MTGSSDYLVKPVAPAHLETILSRVMGRAPALAPVDNLHEQVQRSGHFGAMVGRSGRMELVYEQIARVARTSIPVFIQGESGTGKELAARTVHSMSERREAPFVTANCGALTAALFEDEVFGRGDQPGIFERADGGTLFIDEICDLPATLQARLMRILETGTVVRMGTSQPRQTDVRVVCATLHTPAQAIAAGTLREDLFWRLNVFPIELPPLRERLEDIPLLATHLLREIGRREGAGKRLAPSAVAQLSQYRWPGNVRELRNALLQSYVMSEGDEIRHPWLPRNAAAPVAPRLSGTSFEIAAGTTLAQVEREVIMATLKSCGHHKDRTAAALGVSPKTLYNRLKQYGL